MYIYTYIYIYISYNHQSRYGVKIAKLSPTTTFVILCNARRQRKA